MTFNKKEYQKKYFHEWYLKNKEHKNIQSKLWFSTPKGIEYYKKHNIKKLLPLPERFWKHVDKQRKNECWLWTGCKYPTGYGRMGKYYAHRYSYELNVGKIPEGMCVCHFCDNPSCVNPNHLWTGTVADNMHDRDKKHRDRFSKLLLTKKI